MFLIESQDGCAILYTGDIRAEDWWVDHLKRHPVLLPYTTGMKRLDKLYLDTSWGWRGYDKFASKREGVQELLNKLFKYPDDTIFHLNTWTFGYEDVWVALAAAFNSKIHLNSYLFRLYMSIKQSEKWIHGPFLGGFELGNNTQDAVITTNPDVRFHSCERGLKCPGLKKKKVVYITPIIARIGGEELNEEGIDFGDLNNSDDFSLYGQVKVLLDVLGPTLPSHVKHMLIDASKSRKQSIPLGSDNKEIPLKDFIEILTKVAQNKAKGGGTFKGDDNWPGTTSIRADNGDLLPTWIKFPYSRHSCLPELRNLVGALRPKDIYPCVLEEVDWNEKNSVENIYGDLCSERIFAHDAEMRKLYDIRVREDKKWEEKVEEMAEESQARLHHGDELQTGQGDETQLLEKLEAQLRGQGDNGVSTNIPYEGSFHPTLSSSPPLPDEQVLPPSKRARIQDPETPRTPKRKPEPIYIGSSTPSELSPCKDSPKSAENLVKENQFNPELHMPPRLPPPQFPIPLKRNLNTYSSIDTKRLRVSSGENSIVQPAPKRSRISLPKLINLPPFTHEIIRDVCLESDLEIFEVEEAARAAWGWKNDSWWNIQLESTEKKWRCEVEREL